MNGTRWQHIAHLSPSLIAHPLIHLVADLPCLSRYTSDETNSYKFSIYIIITEAMKIDRINLASIFPSFGFLRGLLSTKSSTRIPFLHACTDWGFSRAGEKQRGLSRNKDRSSETE
ncbi:hypothetical protein Mapa_014319 [Marchantia paleacea]|nr:hypothetical protein Mapa_014319 [Marchantia paleacea]